MPQVIAFSNQKGGVGKTTCTRELGMYLSSEGKKICLVDADPQANLTKSLVDYSTVADGLYEALCGMEWSLTHVTETLTVLAGNISCAALEKSLVAEIDAYTRMKDLFMGDRFTDYDYVFIDCPPSLGILTVNALSSADFLVIPMNPSLYSMQGTNDLMSTIAKVKRSLNPDLELLGVIVNALDRVPVITRQITEEIGEAFGELLFQTKLSKAIAIEEAIASKQSVLHAQSRVSEEVKCLGAELTQRMNAHGKESA